jgi:hypothetical protein
MNRKSSCGYATHFFFIEIQLLEKLISARLLHYHQCATVCRFYYDFKLLKK